MAETDRFPSRWVCTHWYPSNHFVGDESDSHELQSYRQGDVFVLESVPSAEKSYMFMRLHFGEDNVVTGNWYETTLKSGEFKGATYSGSGQLIMNPDTFYMEGKWVGAGLDRKLNTMRIYTGNWEIKPLEEQT